MGRIKTKYEPVPEISKELNWGYVPVMPETAYINDEDGNEVCTIGGDTCCVMADLITNRYNSHNALVEALKLSQKYLAVIAAEGIKTAVPVQNVIDAHGELIENAEG